MVERNLYGQGKGKKPRMGSAHALVRESTGLQIKKARQVSWLVRFTAPSRPGIPGISGTVP